MTNPSHDSGPHGNRSSERVSDSLATRLLERASEIDARLRAGTTVAELRDAAKAAGISDDAFDAALAEVQRADTAPTLPVPAAPTRRFRWWRASLVLAVNLALVVAVVAILAIRREASGVTTSVLSRREAAARGARGIRETADLQLTCLTAEEAHREVQRIVEEESRSGRLRVELSVSFTSKDPSVLHVSAPPEWIRRIRSAVAELEQAPGTVCTLPGASTPVRWPATPASRLDSRALWLEYSDSAPLGRLRSAAREQAPAQYAAATCESFFQGHS